MKEIFDSYRTALLRAKQLATQFSASVPIKKEGEGWYVEHPDVVGATKQSTQQVVDNLSKAEPEKSAAARPKSLNTALNHNNERSNEKACKPLRKPNPPPLVPAPVSDVKKEKPSAPKVNPAHLLAVKVFYLGQGIAASPTLGTAVDMIKRELAALEVSEQNKIREIFFLLLLAEIYRGTDEALQHRVAAKALDNTPNSSGIFEAYMKVTEATQTKAAADKFTGQTIKTGKVESHRTEFKKIGYGLWTSWVVDNALAALRLSPSDLTREQTNFLHQTNLIQIIESEDLMPSK